MDNYVYEYEGKLYLNITNRCSNNCSFCIRTGRDGLEGNTLWLKNEPSFEDMQKALSKFDLSKYAEVVFCGFGEPAENLDTLVKTAAFLKKMGKTVRLNTNGQGSLIHGKDIIPMLKGIIDVVSISLNASNAKKYQEKCSSVYGEDAYNAVLGFARECVGKFPRVVLSLVDEGDRCENQRCAQIAKECGAEFRLRTKV